MVSLPQNISKYNVIVQSLSSVQSLSRAWLFVNSWIAACQASLSITNSRSLPKLMSIESVMPSNHLILCCPLLLLPSILPSIRVFSNESPLSMRLPLSHVQIFATPWTAACHVCLSFTVSWSLLKLVSIESMMPANHLILCHPLLLLPLIYPRIRVFSNELALYIWLPGYWSFSISPSNEYSGLISFRNDWYPWSPCCPRTFKSLSHHHSSKASFLWCSASLSFPGCSAVKNLLAILQATGDLGLIPGWGRSPGGRHGNPLQYSCLRHPHRWRTLDD